MACLLDTGFLLRAFDATCPEYRPIRGLLASLWTRQEALVVTLQNLAEFWNVSTRPVDKNGYGLSVDRVGRRLASSSESAKSLRRMRAPTTSGKDF